MGNLFCGFCNHLTTTILTHARSATHFQKMFYYLPRLQKGKSNMLDTFFFLSFIWINEWKSHFYQLLRMLQ